MTRALLIAGGALVLHGLWILPVVDPSEARYAVVAREMASGGSWLVPAIGGRPHLTKPPLSYWLSALSQSAFGETAWAARLPSAIAFLATLAIVSDLGRRLWGGRAGGWAGWALLFSALPLAASNILTADSLLALFETAAVWCGLRAAAPEARAGLRWALGFHAALALAFLTKGPAGLLAPAALVPFLLRHRDRFRAGRLLWLPGPILFAALALPWYLWVGRAAPGALGYWWGTEVVDRLFGESHRNMPFYVYFPILLGGALPAGILLPAALARLRKDLRSERDSLPAELLLWWTCVPLGVLCLARSRLPLYLLPLFPPLALAMGRWLDGRFGVRPFPARLAIALVAAAGLLGAGFRLHLLRFPGLIPPDPRPAARAIDADLAATADRARVFAAARPGRLPSHGLSFYLRTPVERLDLGSEWAIPSPGPGVSQYFLVREKDAAGFEGRMAPSGGRWLVRQDGMRLWKR